MSCRHIILRSGNLQIAIMAKIGVHVMIIHTICDGNSDNRARGTLDHRRIDHDHSALDANYHFIQSIVYLLLSLIQNPNGGRNVNCHPRRTSPDHSCRSPHSLETLDL